MRETAKNKPRLTSDQVSRIQCFCDALRKISRAHGLSIVGSVNSSECIEIVDQRNPAPNGNWPDIGSFVGCDAKGVYHKYYGRRVRRIPGALIENYEGWGE